MSDELQEYRGSKVLIRSERKKCIHSRNCVLGQPDVFAPHTPGAWIQPDGPRPRPSRRSHRPVRPAPSRMNGWTAPSRKGRPNRHCAYPGRQPIAFRGAIELGEAGVLRATLRRCGASKNKPYCDGSHTAAGFTATGEIPAQESTPLATRDWALEVTPLPDGPLMVEGNLDVVTGTGHTVTRTQKCFLCRRGGSEKKPFCDGTHKKVGFSSAS